MNRQTDIHLDRQTDIKKDKPNDEGSTDSWIDRHIVWIRPKTQKKLNLFVF